MPSAVAIPPGAAATASGPPPAPRPSLAALVAWGLLLAVLAGSWKGAEMRPWQLVSDAGNILEYGRGFFPPDFREWRQYVAEMVVTLQIAVWGTALAVVGAVPLGKVCAMRPSRRVSDLLTV